MCVLSLEVLIKQFLTYHVDAEIPQTVYIYQIMFNRVKQMNKQRHQYETKLNLSCLSL